MSGPLQQLLGVSAEQRQQQAQKEQQRVHALGALLDDPDVTIDAKEALAQHLEEITNVPKQKRGLMGLFANIFHHQQQQERQQSPNVGNLYGANRQVKVGEEQAAPEGSFTANVERDIGPPPVTQRAGSMTSREMQDATRMEQYRQQQGILDKRDIANDERTQNRQLAVQDSRNKAAMDKLTATSQNRLDLLDEQEQQRAQRKVRELVAAGYSPDDAAGKVREGLENDAQLKQARRQFLHAQTAALPERLKQGWQRLDEQGIRNDIYRSAVGNRVSAEQFNQKTDGLFTELRSVRRQIEHFSKFPNDPQYKAQNDELQQLKQDESGLLGQIYNASQETMPQQAPATESGPPRRGGRRGGNYVAPRVSVQRLGELMK